MAGSTDFPTSIDSLGSVTDAVDDVDDDHVNDLRRAVEAIETKVGVDSSAVATSHDYLIQNFMASGRKLWLYENTAPTGWTTVAVTDKVLAVKGGAQAYNVNGGNTGGTWTQPDHTLIIGEMAAHTHGSSGAHEHAIHRSAGGSGARGIFDASFDTNNDGSNSYGSMMDSGGAHEHTSKGGGGAHSHGTTHRPDAMVGIVVEKD